MSPQIEESVRLRNLMRYSGFLFRVRPGEIPWIDTNEETMYFPGELKLKLVKATHDGINALHKRVQDAGIESSGIEGRYHHEIAYELDWPLAVASKYFSGLWKTVDVSEASKQYSIFRPIKRAKARRAQERAKESASKTLFHIPTEELQVVYEKAQEALSGDLQGSIAYYAKTLTAGHAEGMPEERHARIAPLTKVHDVLDACQKLRDTKIALIGTVEEVPVSSTRDQNFTRL